MEHIEIPLFSTITTMSLFREVVESIKTAEQLNALRDVILNYNRNRWLHPLRDPKYGFSTLFRALDIRADELKLIKLSTGYRKSLI